MNILDIEFLANSLDPLIVFLVVYDLREYEQICHVQVLAECLAQKDIFFLQPHRNKQIFIQNVKP